MHKIKQLLIVIMMFITIFCLAAIRANSKEFNPGDEVIVTAYCVTKDAMDILISEVFMKEDNTKYIELIQKDGFNCIDIDLVYNYSPFFGKLVEMIQIVITPRYIINIWKVVDSKGNQGYTWITGLREPSIQT